MDDDNWQSVFLDELTNDPGQEEHEENSDCEVEDDSASQELLDILPQIKSFKEAIVALEDVVLFLQKNGKTEEAMTVGSTIDDICKCRSASTVQTTLERFVHS